MIMVIATFFKAHSTALWCLRYLTRRLHHVHTLKTSLSPSLGMLDEVGRGTVLAGHGSGNEVGFKSGAVWSIELIGYGHASPQRLNFIRLLSSSIPG